MVLYVDMERCLLIYCSVETVANQNMLYNSIFKKNPPKKHFPLYLPFFCLDMYRND